MPACRFAYRLRFRLGHWLIILTILILAACEERSTGLTQTAVPTVTAASQPASTATSTFAAAPGTAAWKTYRNDRAGYLVDYPAGWKITNRIESNGADVTTFTPPDSNNDGLQLTVTAQNESFGAGEIPDMPNTRCQPVTVGKLSGTRCFDTIAFSTTTTFVGKGKVYILAGSGKRLDQNIYQHFLNSFAITVQASDQPNLTRPIGQMAGH